MDSGWVAAATCADRSGWMDTARSVNRFRLGGRADVRGSIRLHGHGYVRTDRSGRVDAATCEDGLVSLVCSDKMQGVILYNCLYLMLSEWPVSVLYLLVLYLLAGGQQCSFVFCFF